MQKQSPPKFAPAFSPPIYLGFSQYTTPDHSRVSSRVSSLSLIIIKVGFRKLDSRRSQSFSVLQKIAKTGSLCCVAARPHESHTASRDWSVGPDEPCWRTNTSFSPPPSRWDFRFQSEELPYGLHDDVQLYGSSTSSNSRGSRGWVRGNHLYNLHYSASDGGGLFLSSSSDHSQGPQWTPPAIQEINIDDYETTKRRGPAFGKSSFRPTMEGTSEIQDTRGSTSSCSDSSESEATIKASLSSHHTFASRRSFMSKPIYPLSFPSQTLPREASDFTVAGSPDFDAATPQRDGHRWSSASSSVDFTDVSESFEAEISSRHFSNMSEGFRCGLCDRFLSQRSPWSSRRIVRSGDMPIAGVLSCCHVFHAECLEQTTPKTRKSDPPCPLCARLEEENLSEQQSFSRLRANFPRLRPISDDGPSRPWGCAQVGDCVEGALHAPPCNSMLLLNRSRIKKNLSLKSNSSKEFPGKLRRSATYATQHLSGKSVDQGAIGCSKSKMTAGLSIKS